MDNERTFFFSTIKMFGGGFFHAWMMLNFIDGMLKYVVECG
jgi:hypothetical protein